MANIKTVQIDATVPWTWASDLSGSDAPLFLAFLNPVWGLRIDQTREGEIVNEHGGHTSMYRLRITGSEAVRWEFLTAMVEALTEVGGSIHTARARDVENRGAWEDLA